MVYSTTTYHCGECRKTYFSYEDARSCEGDHITDRAVAILREKIDAIFDHAGHKIKATLDASREGRGDD